MAKKPRENEVGTGHAGEMLAAEEDRTVGGFFNDGNDGMTKAIEDGKEISRYAGGVVDGTPPTPLKDTTTAAKTPRKTLEEKRADFSRLASARVSRAIDALNALNHLSSPQSYDWTDEAKDKIFATLREKIDTVEASFVEAKAPTEGRKKTSKQLSFWV